MQRASAFEHTPSLRALLHFILGAPSFALALPLPWQGPAALAPSSSWLWLDLPRALRLYLRIRRDAGSALVVA